jgi:DNA-binding IscR family transcriptional regulator
MVLDGPAHCALSVMTLMAIAGPNGPRTAIDIASELDLPSGAVNRALRDLTAARLLSVELEPMRVGYAPTRAPSAVTIAEIIEAAHAGDRALRQHRAEPGRLAERASPAERARRGLMIALDRITLSDVLHAQVRRVGP